MRCATRKNAVCAFLAFAALHLTSGSLLAGDLNPPAGPVGETMKTLQQVEPRKPLSQKDVPIQILADGSYYLTENLRPTGPGEPFVIRIGVDNVTLDMQGFTIYGASGGGQADDGIKIDAGVENVRIFDGSISTCKDMGVDASGSSRVRLENIASSFNATDGFRLGTKSQATHCIAETNGGNGFVTAEFAILLGCSSNGNLNYGIQVGGGSVVKNATATDNGAAGIRAVSGSSIVNCTSGANRGDGIYADGTVVENTSTQSNTGSGIVAVAGSSVIGSTANGNQADGIFAQSSTVASSVARGNENHGFAADSATLSNCTALQNGKYGISLDGGSAATNCTASMNLSGFSLNLGSTATNCQADQNAANGFDAANGVAISASTSHNNDGHGFDVSDTRMADCIATSNSLNGITAGFSYVKDCQSTANHGDGIEAGSTTLLDGNYCRQNGIFGAGYGIQLTGAFNSVFRNVCADNVTGEYSVVAGNKVGTIQVNPALAGPWDNIEFP